MSIDQSSVSRRTIAKGAAWSVPAVAVAAAAPSLAASTTCEAAYTTITKSFTYMALGILPLQVEVTASNIPVTAPVGATLLPISTRSIVTIPSGARPFINLGDGATQFDGTSVSVSTLSGAITTETTTDLTIARTQLPPTGEDLVTIATGDGDPLTVSAGAQPGTVTITMGEPSSTLIGYDADGVQTGSYDSTLGYQAGGDYTLATFEVVEC